MATTATPIKGGRGWVKYSTEPSTAKPATTTKCQLGKGANFMRIGKKIANVLYWALIAIGSALSAWILLL